MIETQRLRLTPLTPMDIEPLALLFLDPQVTRFLPQLVCRDHDAARALAGDRIEAYARQWRTRGLARWGVRLRQDDSLIGWSGLSFVEEFDEVEVLWLLGQPHWGRGVASEAGRAAFDFGFERQGLTRIVAMTLPENAVARRVMEKFGMRYERHARRRAFGDAAVVLYGLSRADYMASLGRAR